MDRKLAITAVVAVLLLAAAPTAGAGVRDPAKPSAVRLETGWLGWLRLLLPSSVTELDQGCMVDPAGHTICGKTSAVDLEHGCMVDPNGQTVCDKQTPR